MIPQGTYHWSTSPLHIALVRTTGRSRQCTVFLAAIVIGCIWVDWSSCLVCAATPTICLFQLFLISTTYNDTFLVPGLAFTVVPWGQAFYWTLVVVDLIKLCSVYADVVTLSVCC